MYEKYINKADYLAIGEKKMDEVEYMIADCFDSMSEFDEK